jgi:monoamine oxidase
MARTPLFALLQRAARIARASVKSPMPTDEAIGHAHQRKLDLARRRFLQEAGAVGAMGLLAGCGVTPSIRSDKTDEVAIVGAGIAGLTAAYRLRQAGIRVRVFEAQNRIGGRMFSLRKHFADGQVIELGGELIDSNHTRIRAMAAELGLPLDDLRGGDSAQEVWFHGGRRYSEAQIIDAFAPIAAAIERDVGLLSEGDITYATPQGAQELDALSVSDWLDRAGANGWLRKLIDVAYTTEMGLECGEQSALNLLTFIGTDKQKFEIFGESDERYHVRGGNDLIPARLADKLADAIELGSVLEALRRDADGKYTLSLRRGNASRDVRATQVLIAIPFSTLRQVRLELPLPGVKQRAIAQLRYGTNAKLMIGFNQRIWRTQHGASGSVYSDLPFQTTWETSREQSGRAGVLTNFTGGQHGLDIGKATPREQADLAAQQLEAIFPGLSATRAGASEARMHWPSHPWTQGSYACFAPGQWTGLRGAMGEPVEHLYFAGEHCALDTQGFMEGGCESGETAAQQIIAARKVRDVAARRSGRGGDGFL